MKNYLKLALLGCIAVAASNMPAANQEANQEAKQQEAKQRVNLQEALLANNIDGAKTILEANPPLINQLFNLNFNVAERYPNLYKEGPEAIAKRGDFEGYLAHKLLASDEYQKLLTELKGGDYQKLLAAIKVNDLTTIKALVEKHPLFITNHAPTKEYGVIPDTLYDTLYKEACKSLERQRYQKNNGAQLFEHNVALVKKDPIFSYLVVEKKLRPTLQEAMEITKVVVKRIGDSDLGSGMQLHSFLRTPGMERWEGILHDLALNLGWQGDIA